MEKICREIPLPWTVGNETAILLISWPLGGAGSIHVTISHRYEGQIVKASTGEWLFHPSSKTCQVQGDDMPLLIEAIESYLDSLGDIQRALLGPY